MGMSEAKNLEHVYITKIGDRLRKGRGKQRLSYMENINQ